DLRAVAFDVEGNEDPDPPPLRVSTLNPVGAGDFQIRGRVVDVSVPAPITVSVSSIPASSLETTTLGLTARVRLDGQFFEAASFVLEDFRYQAVELDANVDTNTGTVSLSGEGAYPLGRVRIEENGVVAAEVDADAEGRFTTDVPYAGQPTLYIAIATNARGDESEPGTAWVDPAPIVQLQLDAALGVTNVLSSSGFSDNFSSATARLELWEQSDAFGRRFITSFSRDFERRQVTTPDTGSVSYFLLVGTSDNTTYFTASERLEVQPTPELHLLAPTLFGATRSRGSEPASLIYWGNVDSSFDLTVNGELLRAVTGLTGAGFESSQFRFGPIEEFGAAPNGRLFAVQLDNNTNRALEIFDSGGFFVGAGAETTTGFVFDPNSDRVAFSDNVEFPTRIGIYTFELPLDFEEAGFRIFIDPPDRSVRTNLVGWSRSGELLAVQEDTPPTFIAFAPVDDAPSRVLATGVGEVVVDAFSRRAAIVAEDRSTLSFFDLVELSADDAASAETRPVASDCALTGLGRSELLNRFAIRPGGDWAQLFCGDRIELVPAVGGAPVLISDVAGAAAWSPNTTEVAFERSAGSSRDVVLFDFVTLSERVLVNLGGAESLVGYSPEGARVLLTTTASSAAIQTVEVATGTRRLLPLSGERTSDVVGWTRHGTVFSTLFEGERFGSFRDFNEEFSIVFPPGLAFVPDFVSLREGVNTIEVAFDDPGAPLAGTLDPGTVILEFGTPDFAAIAVTAVDPPLRGGGIGTLELEIRKQGKVPDAGLEVSIVVLDPGDSESEQILVVPPSAFDGSVARVPFEPGAAIRRGPYDIDVTLDPNGSIDESDEANNALSLRFSAQSALQT
ncbi:MAG: hypothetical protein AAF658_07800, partial [Myxococcota bacterium]